MPDNKLIASASVKIDAPPAKVWEALVNPELIKKYMFGTTVVSDWREGRPIVWKGEFKGKAYEDSGVIMKIEPERLLQYSHLSPMEPGVVHTVTIELSLDGDHTNVSLMQDNNTTEKGRDESAKNWATMLDGMKKLVEELSQTSVPT